MIIVRLFLKFFFNRFTKLKSKLIRLHLTFEYNIGVKKKCTRHYITCWMIESIYIYIYLLYMHIYIYILEYQFVCMAR